MKWENHNYFLSWREPWHKFEDWDWFNGRNFCRDRCMDLVSFDTPEEFRIFAAIMKAGIVLMLQDLFCPLVLRNFKALVLIISKLT